MTDRIHGRYQAHWTIETLAQKVYMSRSALAHRFNELLGIPPIAYLTAWRMDKALDLLIDRQDIPIDNIATPFLGCTCPRMKSRT